MINDIKDIIIECSELIDEQREYKSIDYRCGHADAEDKIQEANHKLSINMRVLRSLLNKYLDVAWYNPFDCKVYFRRVGKDKLFTINLPKTHNQHYYCILKLFRDLDCILKLGKDFIIR